MNRKLLSFLSGAALLSLSTFAAAMPPNFMPALYGDGAVWGTKGTTSLPAPNPHNRSSYDGLFVIVNSNNEESAQLPVSEAAPGNPAYNGGRWITYTVMWTQAAFDEWGTVPILTSYQELMDYEALGYLAIAQGPPEGTPAYFQCPLLPVK